MAQADIAAILALGSAFMIAIGDAIQQRSAHQVTDERVGHVALFIKLLRNKQWWIGSLTAAAGFGLQAAALGFGSVVLVQALLVTSLLFALPISARLAHRRVTPWQWTWAVLLAASVAVIVTVGNPQAGYSRASLGTWAVVAAVLGPVLLLCLLGARVWSGPLAAVLLGVVAGSLWGLFAVLTKGVVDGIGGGLWALLRTPELYVWALVGIAATALQQSAFRAGSLAASLPAVTVSEPLVGSVLGIVVLGETLGTHRAGYVALGIAVSVMVLATAALARGAAAVSEKPADALA